MIKELFNFNKSDIWTISLRALDYHDVGPSLKTTGRLEGGLGILSISGQPME